MSTHTGPWANECDCNEEPMCAKHKAAPALLEALEEVLEVLDSCEMNLEGMEPETLAIHNKVRAAVRAAKEEIK